MGAGLVRGNISNFDETRDNQRLYPGVYSEPIRISKMELFAKLFHIRRSTEF